MEGQQILLKWNSYQTSLNHTINRLRHKNSYTDVTLACNGKFYLLHKFVLANCSDFFHEIFEINKHTDSMIILTGIENSDLEVLIDYMYKGEVNVIKKKITSLMKAAEFLRIRGLANYNEQSESLSCSILSIKQIAPSTQRATGEDEHMILGSRVSCESQIQINGSSENQADVCLIKEIGFQNDKESKDRSTGNERENLLHIDSLPATYPNKLQTIMGEDNPLPMSNFDTNNLSVSSGVQNKVNLTCVSDDSLLLEIRNEEAENNIPTLKRKHTDIGPSVDFSSKRPCKLIKDPDSSLFYFATEIITLDDSCNDNASTSANQGDSNEDEKGRSMCKLDNCNGSFKTLNDLRCHLSNKHGQNHPKIELTFKNWEDLQKWKTEFEEENIVNFALKNAKKMQYGKVSYYQCNRSSYFSRKSRATGKRKPKAGLEDGSSKIAAVCTAELRITDKDGSLYVVAYPTHANHPLDDKHMKCLRLPEALKNEYIKKIEIGIPLSNILGSIDEKVKEQYHITYDRLWHIKKKVESRTKSP